MIKIYTTNVCPYCVMVKKYLKLKGLEWEEINIELDPSKAEEAAKLSGGFTVPVTVIGDAVVAGWKPGALSEAISMLK